MSVYMTEEEQIEAIKSWWKRYSNIILITISVILLSVAGYRYWNWHKEKVSVEASNTYEQMMFAYSKNNDKSVKALADKLTEGYENSVYSDVARLTLAKVYVDENEIAKAKNELNLIIKHNTMPALKQLARLRLARIYRAERAYSSALDILQTVNDSVYLPIINELKGDIYAEKGSRGKALESYKTALHESKKVGMGNLFLEMKMNELKTGNPQNKHNT